MRRKSYNLNEPACDPLLWSLDPSVIFLNHGSFGACPRAVLEYQRTLLDRMERQPVQFLFRDLEPLLDESRAALAQFVGANPDDLVFVTNATEGINTVLHAIEFRAGDELLVTDHEYNACRNALDFIAHRSGARVVIAKIPFPISSSQEAVNAVLSAATERTRLALVDHVTSSTALVLPIAEMVAALKSRGIQTLIDGAHAPGMVPLDLRQIGADYYAGNCHKWLCAPKTAGFLHVQTGLQKQIHPLTISHGANSTRTDRSRFLLEFSWTGTRDFSAALSVPETLRFMSALLPGGWPEIMARNRELALTARSLLCQELRIPLQCPEDMIGSMAAIPLSDARSAAAQSGPLVLDSLKTVLLRQHNIEVPIIIWPSHPHRLLRISSQLYNSLPQYQQLASALGNGLL